LILDDGPDETPTMSMPVPAPMPPPQAPPMTPAPPPASAPSAGSRVSLQTTVFPNRQQFVNSFVAKARPQCFDAGVTLNLPGFQSFVPFEAPADDIVCDERGTLRTVFNPGGRVEVFTVPNTDPLINHLRFFSSLAMLGDCPERAPRWPGCFPLPELGARAPVNLPPGAFFQSLPPDQDRMTVDRFLNMCRLHELILPEPVAGDPQSLVRARNQFSQLGLFTTVGPPESRLRQMFSDANQKTPICATDVIVSALVVRELVDLGMDARQAQAMTDQAMGRGARAEEIVEDMLRACDGKGDAEQCSPVSLSGASLGMDGICSSPMASIGACTSGDAGCGQRRVCLPGAKLMTSGRCALTPGLPECAVFQQLKSAGVNAEVADTISSTSLQNAQRFLEMIRKLSPSAIASFSRGLLGEFLNSCAEKSIGDACVSITGIGNCVPSPVSDANLCFPTALVIQTASELAQQGTRKIEPAMCMASGADLTGDGLCDLCEQVSGIGGLGQSVLALPASTRAFIGPIDATDTRMVQELDNSARISAAIPQVVDAKTGLLGDRNERRVQLYTDGVALESDCGSTDACDFRFDFIAPNRLAANPQNGDVTLDVLAYGHVHTLFPIVGPPDVMRNRRRLNKANEQPTFDDNRVFSADTRPRRVFYTRGTDGRVTKFVDANRSCFGEFFFGGGLVVPVRDPGSSDPGASVLP
jgi:hypothetical protein